jgi:hypothetical protein
MSCRLALCVLLTLSSASPVVAQLASQTALVGTVTDSSGSVLPGAQIVAVNAGTKDTYETTTNAEGYYNIPFVRNGTYEITVSVNGFQTAKATGVEVTGNQVVRTDAVLKIGGLTESVDVEARAQVLTTDTAAVSETIGKRAIVELPLNGRNVWNLAATTPGVLAGINSDIGLSFRGAGQREIQNSLSLDGINSSANLLASTSMRPIADAVEEIQIQTGSTSAEYGSYLGVAINVVTKSGTNAMRGAVFNFFKDDALNSRGWFENPVNPKNPLRSNQFGFEIEGPVKIPGLYDGHNKTFFMGAYEGVRAESLSPAFGSVPTALMRQGNFSEISTAIRNPFTGQPFTGNIIPQSMLSSVSLNLLQYYPTANATGTANNLATTASNKDNIDQFLGRVDQNIGNKIRLYVRYNWHDSLNTSIGAIPVTGVTQPRVNKNTLVTYTHTLKNNLVNDFRIGYHRLDFNTLNQFNVNGLNDAGTSLGIPGFDGDTRYNNPGLPSVNVSTFSGLSAGGTNWYQFDTTFQASDVLAWNRSTHSVRAGFDLRRLATGRQAANDPRGLFNFTGDISGYAMADFMLGLPRTVIPATNQIQGHVGGWRNGFFINDNWQVRRDLTLSLGLRYERDTPVQTYAGVADMLDTNFLTIIPSPNLADYPVKGFEFTEANNKDFAPRLGATYRLSEKTVLRAGYGIYYNPNQMNSFTFLTNNPPLAVVSTYTSDPANPTLSFEHPTGVAGPAAAPDMISPTRHLPDARKDQWSFDVQRELWASGGIDIGYVGSNTSHLDRSFFNNTPTPGPGAVDPRRPTSLFRSRRIIMNDLIADYDAVTFGLRQRMRKGLQADVHYTWSRTRDMSTHSNGGGQTMDNYDIWRDYGPAIWDIPHRLVASYLYDIPFLKSSPQPVLKYLVAGWQVSGVTTIQSGSPVNVTLSADRANIGITGQQRADLVGAVPELNCISDPDPTKYHQLMNCYDAAAFALPAQFTFGNASRNVLRGPKFMSTDLSLMKTVPIGNGMRFQFRMEFYNIFNNVNYGNPGSTYGVPLATSFGRITSAGSMRQMQLGGKILF